MTMVTNRAFLSAATRRCRSQPPSSSLSLLPRKTPNFPPVRYDRDSVNHPHPFGATSNGILASAFSSSSTLHTTSSQASSHAPLLCPSSCRTHPTRAFSARGRPTKPKAAPPKKNKKKDVYKQHLNAPSSIIGKRPGQTSFSPPKEKILFTRPSTPKQPTTTVHSDVQTKPTQQPHAKPTPRARNSVRTTSLVLPLPISQTTATQQQGFSERDNKDQAHRQPSTSSITSQYANNNNDNDDSNPLRKLFLEQGILPPPPRPARPTSTYIGHDDASESLPPVASVAIPEPDPSGVSHANPEDVLDLASMYDPAIHLPDKPDFSHPANRDRYEVGTPLTDDLIAYIGVRGPITVAEFMRRALRDGRFGYYTGKGSREGRGDGGAQERGRSSEEVATEDAGGTGGVASAVLDGQLLEMEDDNDWDLEDDDDVLLHAASDANHVGGEQIIGPSGDFVTAPEVSQLFGESLLIWLMTQYENLNSPSQIQVVEIGPGKGTLICDMVRSAVDVFPDFAQALTTPATSEGGEEGEEGEGLGKRTRREKVAIGVHLVEVTDGMRARQKASLQNLAKEKGMQEKGYSFTFADEDGSSGSVSNEKEKDETKSSSANNNKQEEQSPKNTIHFSWHDVLSSVPTHDTITQKPIPTFIICQELVDALPVHIFQKVEGNVWRERLVDVAIRDEEEAAGAKEDVRLAVSQAKRYASAQLIVEDANNDAAAAPSSEVSSSSSPPPSSTNGAKKKLPRLRFVLPPDTTPALRTLLRVDHRGAPAPDHPTGGALDALPVGSLVEACPEGLLLVQDVADRIAAAGGAALVVDYGGDGARGGETLRGFRRHGQVHPLSLPGETDVTADVDFGALREAVNARVGVEESLARRWREEGGVTTTSSGGAAAETHRGSVKQRATAKPEAFGPISQGRFLAQMGIVERVTKKIEDAATTDEEAEEIYAAMERLMAAEEMGERYKVMAIACKKEGLFPPPAF